MTSATPYADLTPDVVLDAVDSLGHVTDGRILALNSYENRVYQLGLEDGSFVVTKFYRPDRWSDAAILEEHAFALELCEHEIPVVAPLVAGDGETLHEHEGFRFAVFPRQGGRWPELSRSEEREWMGRFLGRIHAVGERAPFEHRRALSTGWLGHDAVGAILDSDWLPEHLTESYRVVTEQLLGRIEQQLAELGEIRTSRIHGDCHPGNVLWTDAGPHFVDLDDCMTGPAVQDLWLFLSGSREESAAQLMDLLEGYGQFCDFDYRELRLIEALRGLRMLHHTAWIARRWLDPAFPKAFPWFDTNKYWEEHVLALKEQLAALEEPVLEVY
ncbi:MAG: serine/threonine protein kinase [Gammaproteobacteria bacterium]|nr:serine/threonine protein kinase [Gammaproteobacteria bacterium]